jgi:hypothetical protein
MSVVDSGFRDVGHPVAMTQPAITELAVLSRCVGEHLFKAAYRVEAICRQGQVV